jgi:plasmid maintenance system killer protein
MKRKIKAVKKTAVNYKIESPDQKKRQEYETLRLVLKHNYSFRLRTTLRFSFHWEEIKT